MTMTWLLIKWYSTSSPYFICQGWFYEFDIISFLKIVDSFLGNSNDRYSFWSRPYHSLVHWMFFLILDAKVILTNLQLSAGIKKLTHSANLSSINNTSQKKEMFFELFWECICIRLFLYILYVESLKTTSIFVFSR